MVFMPSNMTVLKILFGFLVLVTGVLGITVKKECMPRSEWDLSWEGSNIEVTFWLPEEDLRSDLRPEATPLSFLIQFRGTSMPADYDRIEVRPSGADVFRVRDRISQEVKTDFEDPFKGGWNTINFCSNPTIVIRRNGTEMLSTDPGMTIERLEIRGSNVAINCREPFLIWLVDREQRVTVPLDTSMLRHDLSVFSNSPTKPVLTFGSADPIQLGWDGSNVADQILYKKEAQSPIPASVEHKITLSCRESPAIACDVLVGENRKKIRTLSMEKLPDELMVAVGPTENLFVSYRRPTPDEDHSKHGERVIGEESSGPKEPDNSDLGYIVAIALLAVALLLGIAYIAYQKYKNKNNKRNSIDEEKASYPLMNSDPEEISPDHEMLDAISRNDRLTLIKSGLSEIKEMYKIKAHFLGRKEILELFRKIERREASAPKNDMILSIYKELEAKINDIFKAAKLGRYDGSSGIKSKLHDYELPDTIIDEKGRSIHHYMATFIKDRPAWDRDDIADYFKNQEFFINAVDHEGNTVLHLLARNDSEDHLVTWKERNISVEEVLVDMAEIFVAKGANPTLKNHGDSLPSSLARQATKLELGDFLDGVNPPAKDKLRAENHTSFGDLVKAVKEGDNKAICDLLLEGVALLPMSAKEDPLVEAMRMNQLSTVYLLLGAGAPICNRLIDNLTPLDAAHNTLELPACYAAIMRKAFCDRLMTEKSKCPKDVNQDPELNLSEIIDKHIRSIKKDGKEAQGDDPKENRDNEKYSEKVRQLLIIAAANGLSLTCLLLGQRDVYLHPLPGEENPFNVAFTNHHHDTQVALCRDLGMVPFTSEGTKMLSDVFLKDMYYREFKTLLEDATETGENIDSNIANILEEYDRDLDTLKKLPVDLLRSIVKCDLVVLLDKIFKMADKDQIVEEFSQSTMLHIASMHGNIRVIEYLIYKHASLAMLTIGGFTAAHLAAIRGHKECFHYITAWMKKKDMKMVEVKCDIGLTAQQIMENYEALCNNSIVPLMTQSDALVVKNEIGDGKIAHEILYRTGKIIPINNIEQLQNFTKRNVCKADDMEKIRNKVMDVTEMFKSDNNGFIQGKFIPTGPLVEGNELFDITHVDFIFETEEQNMSNSEAIEMITERFPKCVEDALRSFKDNLKCFSLAPPFLTRTPKGIYIRWVWHEQTTFKLLTSYIVPTVMAEDSGVQSYYDNRRGVLVHSTHTDDHSFFSKLEGSERDAWLILRMLRKLTQENWWTPTFKTQYYPKDWHTWSLGVKGLSETTQKKFFIAKKDTTDVWFERVMKTFADIVEKQNGKWVHKVNDLCSPNEKSYVCGILEYLDYLNGRERYIHL